MSIHKRADALKGKWAGKRPWGVVELSDDEELLEETLYLPCRVSLQGPHQQPRNEVTLRVSEKFSDAWMVACQPGNEATGLANNSFATWVADLSLQCDRKCHALLYRAAQMSGIRNVSIFLSNQYTQSEDKLPAYAYGRDPKAVWQYGIWAGRGGRNWEVNDTEVQGFHQFTPDPFTQIGIRVSSNSGIGGRNNSWHKCFYGMALDTVHSARFSLQFFERTEIPLAIFDGSTDIELTGCRIQATGQTTGRNVLVDLSGRPFGSKPAGQQIKISGTIARSEGGPVLYYIDREGELVELFRDARIQRVDGLPFEFEL